MYISIKFERVFFLEMGKRMKKFAALFLSVCLLMSVLSINVSAASKSVKLDKSSISMTAGKTYTLKATVTGFSKYTLQWSTSDKSVASVAKGGKITANKAGTAYITVKVKDTNYAAKCKVTVKAKSSGTSTTTTTTAATTKTNTTISNNTDAMSFVKNIKVGWNLGNTLDAIGNGLNAETSWGNPKTTKAMIDTVKKAGFNTIRIPVSWGTHLDSNNNINAEWMARVNEVVDYAIDNGMYVILNTHHEGSWLIPSKDKEKAITTKYTAIWKQIANNFKDYDEHLIFEGMNEPRTEGSAMQWNGGTPDERKVINTLNQAFVDTVRGTGGNNKNRFLMVTPYAASADKNSLKDFVIPNDKNIIVSIHAYSPYWMALNTELKNKSMTTEYENEIKNLFKTLDDTFLSKGIPVIIGEFGFLNKNNETERAEGTKFYLTTAKSYGVPCIWWDNGSTVLAAPNKEGFAILDRKNLTWYYQKIVDAIFSVYKK